MTLKPKPLRRYRTPAYPTRLEVADRPDLLLQHVPRRWSKKAVSAAALSAVLISPAWSGCSPVESVAPVFYHGEGRGSAGCMMVVPPAFLSEEAAMQIIREELEKEGVQLAKENDTLDDKLCLLHNQPPKKIGSEWVDQRPKYESLEVDAFDETKQVAVEFLSVDDYWKLHQAKSDEIRSSVTLYDFLELAEEVADEASYQSSMKGTYFGTFYDPSCEPSWPMSPSWPWYEKKYDDPEVAKKMYEKAYKQYDQDCYKAAANNTESKRLLREQVRDFIEWLKGQGVI